MESPVIQKTQTPLDTSNRLHNLDYLRGLAAFGIMIYHYLSWTLGKFPSETFLGRVGIYGVSIFYVLSGLTLFYVYHHKMLPSKSDLLAFAKKRFFRIFPLLWLATITAILLSRKFPDAAKLFLNLSGLFGLLKWDAYISTGAWSIGNELVFYIFFPVFIFLSRKNKIALTILSLILLGLYLYFAFQLLDPARSLGEADQWRNYVNPLNQVFLFLGGFSIGLIFKHRNIPVVLNLLILITGLALFIFYPVQGDTIQLVTGINRIVFTVCCFLVCISFYKLRVDFPSVINTPLKLLGEASYSVYLLHPLVYSVVGKVVTLAGKHAFPISDGIKISISIIITLITSYVVYEYFEKYFMRLGREMKIR